ERTSFVTSDTSVCRLQRRGPFEVSTIPGQYHMYDHRLCAAGVHSTLLVEWLLQFETPLVVPNGLRIGYKDDNRSQGRGQGVECGWKEPPAKRDREHQLAILNYGYAVAGERVVARHVVPAGSARGAVRSWTTGHLVRPGYR